MKFYAKIAKCFSTCNVILFTFVDAEYKKLFDEVDADKDGLITFEEFLKFLNTNEIAKDEAEAKSLFDVLDLNKDGKITLEGILYILDLNFEFLLFFLKSTYFFAEVKKGMETIFSELEKAIEASLNKDD